MKRCVQRGMALLLVLITLFSTTIPVFAEDKSAAAMTNSMITFFNSSSKLNTDTVSGNELAVYGVFLSNFLMPGSSSVSDLTSENCVKEIAKTFDVDEETIKKLNSSIQNISKTTLETEESILYIGGNKLVGKELQNYFGRTVGENGGMSDFKIYSYGNSGKKELLDLESPAVEGMWQILFGVCPDFYYDADPSAGAGIFQSDVFRVDAFGNIWCADDTSAEVENYVLVVPACLNPYVFQNKNASGVDKYCLPISNSFAIGGMIDISATRYNISDILSNNQSDIKSIRESINSKVSNNSLLAFTNMWNFNRKKGSTKSILSIYGINSPSNKLHKGISEGDGTENNTKKMLGTDLNLQSDGSANYIVINLDMRNFKAQSEKPNGWSDTLAQSYQNLTDNGSSAQLNCMKYLTRGAVIPFSNVDSSFSWFNFNAGNESSMVGGSMKNVKLEDFATTQSAFLINNPDEGNRFSSAVPSPLLSILGDSSKNDNDGANDLGFSVDDYKKLKEVKVSDIIKNKSYTIASKMLLWSGKVATDTNSWTGGAGNEIELVYGAGQLSDNILGLVGANDREFKIDEILTLSVFKAFTFNNSILDSTLSTGTDIGTEVKNNSASGKSRTYLVRSKIANGSNVWANIYWAYMLKLLNITSLDSVGGFSFDALPQAPALSANVTSSLSQAMKEAKENDNKSGSDSYEEKQKKLLDTVADLLSPDPNENRNGILRGIINGFLIDTHKSITGSRLASSITAGVSTNTSTSYSSAVGYISSPPLKDLPFTSWVAENYTYIYLFLLLLITITLIMMVLTNLRTWRQGVVLFIVMAFALILPQSLLNNAITIGNKFADSMFNDRFTYWAIVEQELSIKNNKLAAQKGELAKQIQDNVDRSKFAYQDEATGVKVKWMSPKKNNVFEALFNDVLSDSALGNNLTIFKWLFNSFFTGDEYVNDDPMATYVYRSFLDIAKDAKSYYDNARTLSFTASDIRKEVINRANTSARVNKENLKFIGADYYVDSTGRGSVNNYIYDIYGNTTFDDSSPFNVHTGYGILQAHLQYSVKSRLSSESEQNAALKVGLGSDTTPRQDVNVATAGYGHRFWHLTSAAVLDAALLKDPADNTSPGLSVGVDPSTGAYTTDAGTQMYLAYTESPYYYFYNVLKERFAVGTTESSDGTQTAGSNMKQNLMDVNSYKYLQNTMDSDGDLRDFLDLEGLFTTVIPVLYEGNLYVREYGENFGLEIESYNFDDITDTNITGTTAFQEGKAKKEKMKNVWNLYCPWVDYMYELDVLNEKVRYMDKRITIGDTLNPGSYDEVGRPMIYSEADMSAKHMDYHNLTDVERRIQNVLESTYTDMLYLLNYYDFDNETLISTAAMFATFNFNREFSGSALLGNNGTIYPQSFELKNFNYDAFLRLTLMNATGIPLSDTSTDMYEVILNKTSWWTGLLIIIVDVLACYAIPACKVLIMLLLLFLGLAFCVTCVVSPPEKIMQSLGKSIVFPTILYMLCNMAFAALIALFMGEGLVSYVGSRTNNIAINDPTVTVLMLILVSGVYLWMLIKLIKLLFTTFKSFGISSVMGLLAVATGAGSSLLRSAKNMATGTARRMRYKKDMHDAFKSGTGGDSGNRSNLPDNSGKSGEYRQSGGSTHDNTQGNKTGDKLKQGMSDFRKTIEDKASTFGTKASEYKDKVKNTIKENGGVRTTIGKAAVKVKHTVKNKAEDVAYKVRDYDYKGAAKSTARKIGTKAVNVKNKAVSSVNNAVDNTKKSVAKGWNKTKTFAKSASKAVRDDMTVGRAERKAKVAEYNRELTERRKKQMKTRARTIIDDKNSSKALKERARSRRTKAEQNYNKAASRSKQANRAMNEYRRKK